LRGRVDIEDSHHTPKKNNLRRTTKKKKPTQQNEKKRNGEEKQMGDATALSALHARLYKYLTDAITLNTTRQWNPLPTTEKLDAWSLLCRLSNTIFMFQERSFVTSTTSDLIQAPIALDFPLSPYETAAVARLTPVFSVQIMSGIYLNSLPIYHSPFDRVYAFIAVQQGQLDRFLVVTKNQLFLHRGMTELYSSSFTDPFVGAQSSLTTALSHALVDTSSASYVKNHAPQAPQALPTPQATPQAFLSPPPVYVAPTAPPPAVVPPPVPPAFAVQPPVYVAPSSVVPPPAFAAAPPVYVAPTPVYVATPPVYVAPTAQPPAPPVYVSPPAVVPPQAFVAAPPQAFVAAPPVHVQQTIQQVPISGTDYKWTFADWRGSRNVPLNLSYLSFNVTLAVMAACDTVTYGKSTLSFVRQTEFQQTHPTHIAIYTQGSTYDLVAIRPSSVLHTTCTAMFQKRAEDVFVWCTLSVNNEWNVPGLFMEWIVPHIDTGRWIVGDSALPSTGNLLPFAQQVSMDFRPNEPKSVVSSFATPSIYENDPLLARISGTNMKGKCDKNNKEVKWAVVSNMTSNTNTLGGAVQISSLERGYQDRINGISSLNCKALDSDYFNTYTTNPHFRFTPPWFSGEPDFPSILCIGDSLTASYACRPNDTYPYIAPAYHTILQAHLTRVGITASIVNIGRPGSAIWSNSTPPAESGNWSSDINQKPHQPQYQTNSGNKWTLAIIWLGTNDLRFIEPGLSNNSNNRSAGIKSSLSADFEGLMLKYKATHYLLVKVDGFRTCTGGTQGALPRGPDGSISCGLLFGDEPTNIVNETLLELEQKYHNVHVADIDYAVDRCREPDMAGAYVHFASNDRIARSLFGRIMCHAVFHRDTGDVRWVGAIPNVKLTRSDRKTFG
jgi:hypothetical protein